MNDAEPTEHYRFRVELVSRMIRDMVGPPDRNEIEVINDRPITKYAAGVLFPQNGHSVEEDASADQDVEDSHLRVDGAPDPAVTMANVRYPSSMGLTFAVDITVAGSIVVEVEAARYVAESTADRSAKRAVDGVEERWRREPLSLPPEPVVVTVAGSSRRRLVDGLELFVRARPADDQGITAVTVALINMNKTTGGPRDSAAFFQPRITVTTSEGTAPFVERTAPGTPDGDDELNSYHLLYRHAPTFATGHGCAVEWDHRPNAINDVVTTGRATRISTTFVPTYDLRLTDSNPDIDTTRLGMLHLAEAPDTEVMSALRALTTGYRKWIDDRRAQAEALTDPALRSIALGHFQQCDRACDRMESGVDLLADRAVMSAFRLANDAMAMQRARTDWLKSENRTGKPDKKMAVWRPFQIAFVLLSLRGIADKNSDDRNLADVLWFPTGGGKTEAYLGLIAFTVFLRRLRNPRDAGVTVLMRYTLRLLTAQQFERAALLICCMESLRKAQPSLLGPEISIGMWVGQDSTPNMLDSPNSKRLGAKQALAKLAKGDRVEKGNPVQLGSCPWCGRALDHRNHRIVGNRMVIACGSRGCEFGEGLPVHVVDQTIYDARPTMIIATADKFASIPWKPEVAQLFNRGTNESPPELIIQDELHLISGPLGTLAGLYETVVDLAADRPKIVASTATIRRAIRQGGALFDRSVQQFPPPGLDARDSYFSVETPPSRMATRRYVGLLAPATSQTTLLVRTYAALLHHAKAIDASEEVRDPYWTLLGYFNSLRLLAGAKLQLHDDVDKRLGLLAKSLQQPEREIIRPIELTSREPSSDIPLRLKEMTVSLPGDAIDIILATNMISVGMDVDRLGLMVVMGQPQSTSEYIQATSRVGRRHPGLVVTMFNSARSRDRSHYENFASYHSALYRQVEATSVTPFSARARDRGLHAVVVGLARLLIPEARPREAAASIAAFEATVRKICEQVLERVERVAGPTEREATENQIDKVITQWLKRAEDNSSLVYDDFNEPGNGLLVDAGRYDESDDELADTMPTLWSMRDVDVESKLYLDRGNR